MDRFQYDKTTVSITKDYYTIFDLPILVTNSISTISGRPTCDSLNNPMMPVRDEHTGLEQRVDPLRAPGDKDRGGDENTSWYETLHLGYKWKLFEC